MTKKEIMTILVTARLNNMAVGIEVEDTPFSTETFEFIDFNIIQVNDQIYIFNESVELLLYLADIKDIQTRELTTEDVANRLKQIPKDQIFEKSDILDSFTETLKDNQDLNFELEMQKYIADKTGYANQEDITDILNIAKINLQKNYEGKVDLETAKNVIDRILMDLDDMPF